MRRDIVAGLRCSIVEGFGAMPSFQAPLDCFLPALCAALSEERQTRQALAMAFPSDLASAMMPGAMSDQPSLLGEVAEELTVVSLTQGSLGLSALACGGRFVLEFAGRICAVGAGVATFMDWDPDYVLRFFRAAWADVDSSEALWRFFSMATGERCGGDEEPVEPFWPRPLPSPGPEDAVFEEIMGHPTTIWKYDGFSVVSGNALMVRMDSEGPCWAWSWGQAMGLSLSLDQQDEDGAISLACSPVDSWFWGADAPRLGPEHAGATMWFAANVPKPRMVSRALEAFVEGEIASGTDYGRAMAAAGWGGCL